MSAPYITQAYTCHAATTVGQLVDGQFQPLADVGGLGRHSSEDAAIASRIASALNLAVQLAAIDLDRCTGPHAAALSQLVSQAQAVSRGPAS